MPTTTTGFAFSRQIMRAILVLWFLCVSLAAAAKGEKGNKEKKSKDKDKDDGNNQRLPMRKVVTGVQSNSATIYPIVNTAIADENLVFRRVEGITGIAYSDDQLYAVSSGLGDYSRMLTIDYDFYSPPSLQGSSRLLDIYGSPERVEAKGLLCYGDEFWIPSANNRVGVYGEDLRKVKQIDPRRLVQAQYEGGGKGITSVTLDPDGESVWGASLVGKRQDGPRHVRLMQIGTLSGTSAGYPEFVYILDSDYPIPGDEPSASPTDAPTSTPSHQPSVSQSPSLMPSSSPSISVAPSSSPSAAPSVSMQPSATPSESTQPSAMPTESAMPSALPSSQPSESFSPTPINGTDPLIDFDVNTTASISDTPTSSSSPSHLPSQAPTGVPTGIPSSFPTSRPTASPSEAPTKERVVMLPRNGLVSLIALDSFGDFLALERVESHLVEGVMRHTLKLFYVETASALDVSDVDLINILNLEDIAVKKTLLLDFDDLDLNGAPVPNLDTMTLVPPNKNNPTVMKVLLASNNQFQPRVDSSIITLQLNWIEESVVGARVETQEFIGGGHAQTFELEGRAERAMVWVHPDNPELSLILATHGAGLTIFNLNGMPVQDFTGESQGYFSSTEVPQITDLDIIYSFPISVGSLIDVAILVDSDRGVLDFRVVSQFTSQGNLVDVTGSSDVFLPAADIVVAYTSGFTGHHNVFVGDKEGDQIFHLLLSPSESGLIDTTYVRTIALPPGVMTAMTVDKDLGYLYVAVVKNNRCRIYKYDAEPDSEDLGVLSIITTLDSGNVIKRPFSDLTIYYAGDYKGYLIASHSTDTNFVVYDRAEGNKYLGVFAVGTTDLDYVATSHGIAALNVNLGPEFSCGMMVVQDSINAEHRIQVEDNMVYNFNTNFKLVAWDEITLNGLPDVLQTDTHSWGPRRFALSILIDVMCQQVYLQMTQGHLPVRTAQKLLMHLGNAAYALYQLGSQMRQLLNPTGASQLSASSRRRRLNSPELQAEEATQQVIESRNLTTRELDHDWDNIFRSSILPRCSADSNSDELIGSYATARAELKEFTFEIGALIAADELLEVTREGGVAHQWNEKAQAIFWAIPEHSYS